LSERDLRVRSHSGALTRYYLDALLGLIAIRAHAAEYDGDFLLHGETALNPPSREHA